MAKELKKELSVSRRLSRAGVCPSVTGELTYMTSDSVELTILTYVYGQDGTIGQTFQLSTVSLSSASPLSEVGSSGQVAQRTAGLQIQVGNTERTKREVMTI